MTTYDDFVKATREYRSALTAAETFTDPDLSTEGLEKRRDQMRRLAEERERKRVDALADQMRSEAALAAAAVERTRPTLPNDPLIGVRVQAALDGIKARMATGRGLGRILAEADRTTVLAARELADQLAALTDDGKAGVSGDDVRAVADQRLAALDPVGFGTAHAAAVRTRREAAAVDVTLADLNRPGASRGSGLQTALAARFAREGLGEPGSALTVLRHEPEPSSN